MFNVKNRKKMIAIIMLCFSIFVMNTVSDTVYAYKFTGLKLSDPKHVKIYVPSKLSSYSVVAYAKKWDDYCSEIGMYSTSAINNANIVYDSSPSVDNGTYGVTYPAGDKNIIVFYSDFFASSTTSIQRSETIVHETGHALGLDHPTEATDPSKAVMRAYGFNKKAYPLSDDKAGIRKLY